MNIFPLIKVKSEEKSIDFDYFYRGFMREIPIRVLSFI